MNIEKAKASRFRILCAYLCSSVVDLLSDKERHVFELFNVDEAVGGEF